jgi:DNA-binding NtrC family response regulator
LSDPDDRADLGRDVTAETARGLQPVVVLHGTAAERDQIARVFHRDSPVRNGRIVRLDVSKEEERLRVSLEAWMSGVRRASETDPLHVAERGTLFLDHFGAMGAETQRLLTLFLGPEGIPGSRHGWSGRLVAGDPGDILAAVERNGFDPGLYRALERVRVELEHRGPASA